MSQPALGFSLDLEFWEAIEAARARGVVLPDEFYDGIPADARRTAFTVSHLNSLGQIQAVLDKLTQALQEGRTLADFQEWAKGQNFDLTDWHLETVFRTGVQTAYNAGHWRHFDEFQDDRPFLMYDAINDSRTRPHHAACDGIIRPVGDPFWRDHSPPLGFNCRCTLISLSAKQAQARSKNGKGLNKPADHSTMHADGAGWGGKPTEWAERLDQLAEQRVAKAAPAVAAAAQERYDRWMKYSEAEQLVLNALQNAVTIAEKAITFADIWRGGSGSLNRHIKKRIKQGHILDGGDYLPKVAASVAAADLYILARGGHEPTMALVADSWVVIYTGGGEIITAYAVEPIQEDFETACLRKGLTIDKVTNDGDIRAESERLYLRYRDL